MIKKQPRFKPYIGVTGFMTQSEVASAIEALEEFSPWSRHGLMVGVLVSAKTLAGETNSRENQYPKIDDVAGLFSPHRRVTNLIHFNSSDNAPAIRVNDFQRLKGKGGRNFDGVQINIAWPVPNSLECFVGKRVVLQIGREALRIAHHNPTRVAQLLYDYVETEVISDVLVDMGDGNGIALNVAEAEACVHAIRSAHPTIGIGVAGGLCREAMGKMKNLASTFPDLSFDAQGRLRTPDDHLNVDAMQKYLRTASSLFP